MPAYDPSKETTDETSTLASDENETTTIAVDLEETTTEQQEEELIRYNAGVDDLPDDDEYDDNDDNDDNEDDLSDDPSDDAPDATTEQGIKVVEVSEMVLQDTDDDNAAKDNGENPFLKYSSLSPNIALCPGV